MALRPTKVLPEVQQQIDKAKVLVTQLNRTKTSLAAVGVHMSIALESFTHQATFMTRDYYVVNFTVDKREVENGDTAAERQDTGDHSIR